MPGDGGIEIEKRGNDEMDGGACMCGSVGQVLRAHGTQLNAAGG